MQLKRLGFVLQYADYYFTWVRPFLCAKCSYTVFLLSHHALLDPIHCLVPTTVFVIPHYTLLKPRALLGIHCQNIVPHHSQGYGLATSVYSTGRALVPGPLDGVAGSLESTVSQISAPIFSSAQSRGGKVPDPKRMRLMLCRSRRVAQR